VPRERFLSEEEIKVFWDALTRSVTLEIPTDVLRLCLLLGQRVGEIAGLPVDELDAKCTLWQLPAARSKNKQSHSIPIPLKAREILQKWRDLAVANKQSHLFQTTLGGPMKSTNIANYLDDAREEIGLPHFTSHDLRRTVSTHMARLGISRETIGAALNHRSTVKRGVTGSVYDQYNRLPEVRGALEAWGSELDRLTAEQSLGANIVDHGHAREGH